MPAISSQQLVALQSNSNYVRNICILAHVDHGKTSLSDCLLSSNGIISPKLAGKVRFLDSRPDEQIRGITMESSAISLYFQSLERPKDPESQPIPREYLINLIDSPGHVDFSSEVSTASRLCDGAVVLVDAVEGVCSQTVNVLRQTWVEKLKPVLVINKIDRLITELQLSSYEAYIHLSKLVEDVNAVMGSFSLGERMQDDLNWRERNEKKQSSKIEADDGNSSDIGAENGSLLEAQFEDKDDEDLYFSPEKFNVIFASAIDGWAFTVKDFAAIHEKKLGVKREILEKVLWGDYYLDPKTKRILQQKHLKGRNLKPMFVQFALDNIWAIYENILRKDRDQEKIEKIVKTLGLRILPRDLKSKDTRGLLLTMFTQWLPLSRAVLGTVVSQLPSPSVAQKQRIPALVASTPGSDNISESVKSGMENLDPESDMVVAYVSKMVAVPERELPKYQRQQLTAEQMRELGRQKRQDLIAKALANNSDLNELQDQAVSSVTSEMAKTHLSNVEDHASGTSTPVSGGEEDALDKEHLIGFARLYSGTINVGQKLQVLGPKYNPAHPDQHVSTIEVTDLYLLMGRELISLERVPAGNVFGIGGLEGKVLKNGTLCSQSNGAVNLAAVAGMGTAPIVRVALEPKKPSQMDKLITGLKLLEQADPCVEYLVQESGEHVILTAGELHLERCLKDLRERFAKIEIQASKPIVPYRETIISAAEMSPPKDAALPRGTVQAITSGKHVSFRIRTRPLPADVTQFLTDHVATLKRLHAERHGIVQTEEAEASAADIRDDQDVIETLALPVFKSKLQEVFDKSTSKEEKDVWKEVVDKITAFGPKRTGPNLLVDATQGLCQKALQELDSKDNTGSTEDTISGPENTNASSGNIISSSISPADIVDRITHAFQLAMFQGPLCNEPVQGVAVFLEEVKVDIPEDEADAVRMKMGQLIGEVMTTVSGAIKQGFLDWSPRLLLAMYSCDIQASTEVLGKVYSVITRRRGRIVAEDLKEGTPFFTVRSLLPVAESFGFADEIRSKTSGAASPQLIFSGYENILDEDPFWVPFTEDDLEDLGELADRENIAKKYMEAVRKRKGLFVAKRLVGADKQRTRKR